jgi:hypothetical protein
MNILGSITKAGNGAAASALSVFAPALSSGLGRPFGRS